MRRRALSFCLASLFPFSTFLFGQDPPSKTANEERLRSRISEFYQDLVDHKFRKAELLVDEADRDAYYAMEKPQIKNFSVVNLTIDGTEATAKVQCDQVFYPPRIMKPIVMPLAGSSHWVFKEGDWWWMIPEEQTRQTPFGPVIVRKEMGAQVSAQTDAEAQPIDPHQKRLEGPTVQSLQEGVKADTRTLKVPAAIGSSGSITLANSLRGLVRLVLGQGAKQSSFKYVLSSDSVAGGKTATLTATRQKESAPVPERLFVFVLPTQQSIEIAVQ